MKAKLKRKDLLDNNDIWNAVIDVLSEYELSNEERNFNDAYIVYHYYSEMESGGHESLFNWFQWYIEKVGIDKYLNELIGILEKIGAHDYANIEKKYGHEMWRLFLDLEEAKVDEDEFYHVIEKANGEYNILNGKLEKDLEAYFVKIHTDLIEVVED